ncbi:hypothetical protein SOVF_183080 [Spinacia oleracea]|nr:hypothetical protein SOVF_183080 [Spinacia oleracea]
MDRKHCFSNSVTIIQLLEDLFSIMTFQVHDVMVGKDSY